jgi:hypothetical protein
MKAISISISGAGSAPVIFLISPATTAGSILDQLKIEDYVIFAPSDPGRLFYNKDELHDKVQSGDRLVAATLLEASEAYRRSKLYGSPRI